MAEWIGSERIEVLFLSRMPVRRQTGYIGELADLLATNGMVANFIASLPAEEVYHAAQQLGVEDFHTVLAD